MRKRSNIKNTCFGGGRKLAAAPRCVLATVAGLLVLGWLQRYLETSEDLICLNAIMKNEANSLPEFLELVVPHISGWIVCDTGSTDDSVQIVTSFFDRRGVKGKMLQHQWRSFDFNRNLCMEEGSKQRRCKFWLLLDVDQRLHADLQLSLLELNYTEAGYLMKDIINNEIENHKISLIRADFGWKYEGRIHEILRPPQDHDEDVVVGLLPDSIYTSHHTNFRRNDDQDEKMLRGEISEFPDRASAYFHLGKLLLSRSSYREGIEMLIRNSLLSDSEEEKFYDHYLIAKMIEFAYAHRIDDAGMMSLLARLGKIESGHVSMSDVITGYEFASSMLPYRFEPYCRLAVIYWNAGDSFNCYNQAYVGSKAGPNSYQTLLAEEDAEDCCLQMMDTCRKFIFQLNEDLGLPRPRTV